MPCLDYVNTVPPLIAFSIVLAVNNLTVKFKTGLLSVYFFCHLQRSVVFPVALSNTVHRFGQLEAKRPIR